jgi:DNA-binding Lrp family transcriptional regulator
MGKILLFVQLSQLKKPTDYVLDILSKNEEIIEIHILTGTTDILFKLATRDLESAFSFLKELNQFATALTSTVLYTHLDYRPIKPSIELK